MTFYTSATGARWIVPKKYVEQVGDEGFKKAPIGAGPYKFVSFAPGLELTMEANDQYWRKKPSVHRLVFRVIPDESTRLAALKRGEIDIAYSIRGELAEEIERTKGLTPQAYRHPGPVLALLCRPVGPEVALARPAGAARGQPRDRPQGHQSGSDARHSKITGSIIPLTFEHYWQPPAPVYDPAKAKKLLAEAGHPNGFDAGDYYCDTSYSNVAEAVMNNLQAIGIRAKLRPLERAAFFKGYSEKSYKNIIQGASGAFGNTSTRLEAFVVKGGTYAYGSYPDLDALFQQQATELDRQEARGDAAKDARARTGAHDVRAHLAAGIHQRRRAAGRRVGLRLDRRPRLLGALRGRDAGGQIAAAEGAMARYIVRRIGYSLLSLFLLSLTIFLFVRVTGDPTALLVEPGASQADIDAIRQRFGLDQPIWVQYWSFMASLAPWRSRPVLLLSHAGAGAIPRAPAELAAAGAGGHGVLAADRRAERNSGSGPGRPFLGSGGKVFSLLGLSLPSFWVGLVLILFFSVYLEWLPSSGSGTVWHLLMPAFALGWYFAAAHMRLTRSSMLDVLGSEYIKLARLKGLPEALVIGKHAFKNALIPVLTLAGINLVIMINVAVVVETVFAWPGVGRLLYEGITFRDFPVVQAVVLLGGAMIVVVNLLIDVLYAVIDPRIRLEA